MGNRRKEDTKMVYSKIEFKKKNDLKEKFIEENIKLLENFF
jgi:hypothetical protein